jgi:hypothetical protein
LTAGIAVVGLGLGLGVLLGVAARQPEIALGLGGAVAIVGATFIIAAYVVQDPDDTRDTPDAGRDRPSL